MTVLRALVRRPAADSALVAHAIVVHAVVALLLRPIGFRRLTAWLARAASIGARRDPRVDAASRVVWAVRTATHLVPGGRTCLTEALTAQHLLRRRGEDATLCLGVSRSGSGAPIAAHAWLERAGRIIIGGETAARFQPMIARKEMP
jgi:transglutaminase superfamily protein